MSRKVEQHIFEKNKASIPAGAIMPLFFVRVSPIGSQSIFSKYTEGLGCVLHFRPSRISTSVCRSTLHTAVAIVSTLLDRGLPMIGYLMPSASPLIIFLIGGCTALMLHIPSDFDGDKARFVPVL